MGKDPAIYNHQLFMRKLKWSHEIPYHATDYHCQKLEISKTKLLSFAYLSISSIDMEIEKIMNNIQQIFH